MNFQYSLEKLISSKEWEQRIGTEMTYNALRLMIVKSLGVADMRTISKWIGKISTPYIKKDFGMLGSRMEHKPQFQEGMLENLGFIEHYVDPKYKEYNYGICIKILRGKNPQNQTTLGELNEETKTNT